LEGHDPNQHRVAFFKEFLRRGVSVASATPSSRWMCRELARGVEPGVPQKILELGAGPGVVTREIERRMHPESTLVAVERLAVFEPFLKQTTRCATIMIGSVEALWKTLRVAGPFDLVVSGLPFPSLSRRVRAAVLALLRQAAPGATFSQLTEIPFVYKPLYQRCFHEVKFCPVALNLPPGGVYHCSGVKRQRLSSLD